MVSLCVHYNEYIYIGAIIEKSADIVRMRRELREEDELREVNDIGK